jgi:hypothetical protein
MVAYLRCTATVGWPLGSDKKFIFALSDQLWLRFIRDHIYSPIYSLAQIIEDSRPEEALKFAFEV